MPPDRWQDGTILPEGVVVLFIYGRLRCESLKRKTTRMFLLGWVSISYLAYCFNRINRVPVQDRNNRTYNRGI